LWSILVVPSLCEDGATESPYHPVEIALDGFGL
jgi:hypothetical protein